MESIFSFPQEFIFGTATAAFQVEGATHQDGRGDSIWDTQTRLPGVIKNGDTADFACDQYHRYEEDVALMKDLGVSAYRFSLSWPRLQPEGRGAVNPQGIDYYNRLIDALLKAGITPWVTLFHWDLPQSLQDSEGGWLSPHIADHFGDYAGLVAHAFSDRVKNFFTVNEFYCFTDKGYVQGDFPPRLKLPPHQAFAVRHHALVAHGRAVQALRASARGPIRVGFAENSQIMVPVIETPENVEAAKLAFRESNGAFITPILEGAYPERYLQTFGNEVPAFNPEDFKIIAEPLDFIGLNMYTPVYVQAEGKTGYKITHPTAHHPRMHVDWLKVDPSIAYWGPRIAWELWEKDIYITENGCSGTDVPDETGAIVDTDRVFYLRHHLREVSRCISDGIPLKGYFLWSLLDNFEWNHGYSERFGIVYVDFSTQKRSKKLSYSFYKGTISRGRVV
ncbi:MAG: beta-glucosidase [Spirochaetales bacterium]|nr:beta-glucosidase [Spirochaetales bacterium]